ncbi:MAG: transcription termination/antitermination protein NusG [Proteobacteria bacterium]|nr:transcription termination/antitermination protein NusG [Pseudomonadota bacterium]
MAQQWYVVHVYAGSEKKVAQAIRDQAELYGLEDDIGDVMVPSEKVTETKRGVKREAEYKFFPGYILVKMELTDQAWHVVQSQNRVTGFLGGGGKPIPISSEEAERLLQQISEGVDRPRAEMMFEIGEQVRIAEGPFESFKGLVEEVDSDKSRLKVTVSIFGRETPVDLEFSQVEKS